MQYRVDSFLPQAFDAIDKIRIGDNSFFTNSKQRISDGRVFKEYKGYISSLGANIVQAGVKAAIAFYEAEESGSGQDRRLVNAAIKFILVNPSPKPETYNDCNLTSLLQNLNEEQIQVKALEILDAATALKLALRTYKMK